MSIGKGGIQNNGSRPGKAPTASSYPVADSAAMV